VVSLRRLALVCWPWLVSGCGSEAIESDGQRQPGTPAPASSAEEQVASLLTGTASGGAATFVTIYDPSDDTSGRPLYPTALAWNPTAPDELWVTLREPPSTRTCNKGTKVACTWLMGRVAIVEGAGSVPEVPATITTKEDANAWHFMRRPSSIAFGSDATFATCGEARTGNYEDEDIPFNGPVLWSADPAIFGATPPADSPTGSTHIDMLHESPYCMGIAHERDNVYWTFNGDAGSLDRYDFHAPHEPGGDDHSDGELWRYATGALARAADVPSHLAYDASTGLLYAADTGHGRIVALDTTSGTPGADVTTYDPIETHVAMNGARLFEIVAPGVLEQPSGLTLYQGVLFVTDFATSRIAALTRSGRLLTTLYTGLPAGSLGAIAIGPDGRAYVTDRGTGRVLRIDPALNRP
jgi:sugar lactone lactonase YvrE